MTPPTDRGASSAWGRGGRGGSPGIFLRRGFLQKIQDAKTRKIKDLEKFWGNPRRGRQTLPQSGWGASPWVLSVRGPACGNDDKRTGNQVSGLRWRVHEKDGELRSSGAIFLALEGARKPSREMRRHGAGKRRSWRHAKHVCVCFADHVENKRISLLRLYFWLNRKRGFCSIRAQE
jgi:hypothetical protein